MKLGVMSDLHLGLRQYGLEERENDFYEQYERAIQTFVDNKVDLVIIGGDVFDKPRPSPKALESFSKGLKKLNSNGIEVVNIIGNHAMVQAPGFVTADEFFTTVFDSVGNYMLLDTYQYYLQNDVCVMGLPYYHNFKLDDFKNTVSKMNEEVATLNSGVNILVLHQAFKEFCGFTGEDFSITELELSNFDLVICGHIHERKLVDQGDYIFLQPGSIERLSVAEARDEEQQGKGVYIIDTDNCTVDSIANGFIPLRSPRMFCISDMYMNSAEDVVDIENEIISFCNTCQEQPIVFLTVHDVSNSFQQLVNLTNDLRGTCLTVNFNYIDESIQVTNPFSGGEGDIMGVTEALKIALNPLDEDDARLGMDLYNNLKDGKDVSEILEEYRLSRKSNVESIEDKGFHQDEVDDLIQEVLEFLGEI